MNKKVLTIKTLKKDNDLFKFVLLIFLVMDLTFLIIGVFSIYDLIGYIESTSDIFELIKFSLLSIFCTFMFFILIFGMKNERKENTSIDKYNFKLIEDKICDNGYVSEGKRNSYYIITRKYGKVITNSHIYDKAQKDDLVYLLFYNGDENQKRDNEDNDIHVDQVYLSSEYEISSELKVNLVRDR